MRENKEKQALSDLMIKPVQRIPRYELLVKVGVVGQGSKHGGVEWGCMSVLSSRQKRKSPLIPMLWSLLLQQSVSCL